MQEPTNMNELMSVITLHVQSYLTKHVSLIIKDICSKYNLSTNEVMESIPSIPQLTYITPTKKKITYEAPIKIVEENKYELVSVKPTKRNKTAEKRPTKKPTPPSPDVESETSVVLMDPPIKYLDPQTSGCKRPGTQVENESEPITEPVSESTQESVPKEPVLKKPTKRVSKKVSQEPVTEPVSESTQESVPEEPVLKKPTKRVSKKVPQEPVTEPVSESTQESVPEEPVLKKPTKRVSKKVPQEPVTEPVSESTQESVPKEPVLKKPTKRVSKKVPQTKASTSCAFVKTTEASTKNEDIHVSMLPKDEVEWFEESYFPPKHIANPPPPEDVYYDDEIMDDYESSDDDGGEEVDRYEKYVLNE